MAVKTTERLQKIIAAAGITSRREAEEWIRAGRIQVDGKKVTQLGHQVDPHQVRIQVDGKPLAQRAAKYYYAFHKPKNVLVARRDPRGRPLIYDWLQGLPVLVHPAGRLDFDSEGLLLLTNDGILANRLTHPSGQVEKVYHVKVKGKLSQKILQQLRKGIRLDDGLARAIRARLLKENQHNGWCEVVMTEGRKREVRRMCEALDLPVLRLKRVAIGPLQLGALKAGDYRPLRANEVDKLKHIS